MPTVTIRNLPNEVHRALKIRAATHGRSTEAEIRHILESTVHPPAPLRLGTALAELGRRAGLTDEDIDAIEQTRDQSQATPVRVE